MSASVDLRSAFGTDDSGTVVERLEVLKSALDTAPSTASGWTPNLPGFVPTPSAQGDLAGVMAGLDSLEKGVGGTSAETIASLKATLAGAQADIVKDFTLTSPLSTGYVAYDLEAPSL